MYAQLSWSSRLLIDLHLLAFPKREHCIVKPQTYPPSAQPWPPIIHSLQYLRPGPFFDSKESVSLTLDSSVGSLVPSWCMSHHTTRAFLLHNSGFDRIQTSDPHSSLVSPAGSHGWAIELLKPTYSAQVDLKGKVYQLGK